MQIKVYSNEGVAEVAVVDPSDGAVTHNADLEDGQMIVVTATSAHSPADIEFGEVEAIAEPDAETEAENERKVAEQPPPPDSDEEIDSAAEQAPEGEAEQGGAREKDL